jgi:hypothetical protein
MLNKIRSEDLYHAARLFHEQRPARAGDDQNLFDSIRSDMHTLDAKSTGLITFISLVLAALTFALNLVDRNMDYSTLIKGGLIAFIATFSLAAWFSLRCLEMTGPPFTKPAGDPMANEQEAIAEVAVRRFNYFLSLRITRGAFTMLVPFIFAWIGLLARELY